ncbi:MAG: PorP/SprF family type IX secretion system membrane protein [Chitinophagales bacterium]
MKRFLLSSLIIFTLMQGRAQDVHFSQFGSAPLLLNPALTGLSNCTYRASLNYRNQWASIVGPSSYQTYAGAFDIGLFRESFNYSMLGLGLMVFNDVSGDGALSNLTMMGSLAYHQNMAGRGDHYISIGIQGGMVQKKVDYGNLVFESMIGQNGVDPNLPSGEYGDDKLSYFDLNTGVNWRSRFSNAFSLQLGAAYHHLGEPSESFYNRVDNKINAKYTAYGSLKIGFDKFVLIPSGVWLQQTEQSNQEITTGATFGIPMDRGNSFVYIGAHYRVDDAIIPSLGFDYNNVQFGLSYDINVSDLSAVSAYKGGIELSLIYTGCLTHTKKYTIDCPRFM